MILRKNYPSQQHLKAHFTYLDGFLIRDGVKVISRIDKTNCYYKVRFEKSTYCVHRMIYILINGDIDRDLDIDHIDRNKLNNDINNLKACTRAENRVNTGPTKDNALGLKGIYIRTSDKSVRAVYNRIYIGTFKTVDEAVIARNNFISEVK